MDILLPHWTHKCFRPNPTAIALIGVLLQKESQSQRRTPSWLSKREGEIFFCQIHTTSIVEYLEWLSIFTKYLWLAYYSSSNISESWVITNLRTDALSSNYSCSNYQLEASSLAQLRYQASKTHPLCLVNKTRGRTQFADTWHTPLYRFQGDHWFVCYKSLCLWLSSTRSRYNQKIAWNWHCLELKMLIPFSSLPRCWNLMKIIEACGWIFLDLDQLGQFEVKHFLWKFPFSVLVLFPLIIYELIIISVSSRHSSMVSTGAYYREVPGSNPGKGKIY